MDQLPSKIKSEGKLEGKNVVNTIVPDKYKYARLSSKCYQPFDKVLTRTIVKTNLPYDNAFAILPSKYFYRRDRISD